MPAAQWAPVAIYGTTVSLGLVLGWHYLNSRRPPVIVQAIHALTGLGGLEAVLLLMRRAPGAPAASTDTITIAGLLLAGALLTGLFAAVFHKSHPHTTGPALTAHAMIGASAFLVLLSWAWGL
ncbi:MAG: hypothetical protein WCO82_05240 [Sphingomonadales bacterium]